jgi:hypothetical protein
VRDNVPKGRSNPGRPKKRWTDSIPHEAGYQPNQKKEEEQKVFIFSVICWL